MTQETKRAGYFSEYLDLRMNFGALTAERKKQLERIALRRGRAVLVYAARMTSREGLPNHIVYDDLMPIQDQLMGLQGTALDLILETPGGFGEVAEDFVKVIRKRFDSVAVIVPGYAKSAGTMIALSADEILMGKLSALGPIDAQISYQGKSFSAHALLEGFAKIKTEADASGKLNPAYYPMLLMMSPGELQEAENVQRFSRALVKDWLENNKFKNWTTHSSTGKPVTPEEKRQRAEEIAEDLCDHSKWLTHARSIRMEDLLKLGVKITDYTADSLLAEAIDRYYTLMQMSFEIASIYKIFETPKSQIYRLAAMQGIRQVPVMDLKGRSGKVDLDINCGQCGQQIKIQGDFGEVQELAQERIRFPKDNRIVCPKCGNEIDLSGIRREIEVQTGHPII